MWVSPDPIDRFHPQSSTLALNLYQYGLWNPLRYTDPEGREEEDEAGKSGVFQRIFQTYRNVREAISRKVGEFVERGIRPAGGATRPGMTPEELAEATGISVEEAQAALHIGIGERFAGEVGEISEAGTREAIDFGAVTLATKGLAAAARGAAAGNLKALSKSRIKALGIDAEALKADIVGSAGGRYNIAADQAGNVFLTSVQKGAGPPISTGFTLESLAELFPLGR